jgi:hypothetical protein
MSIGTDLDGCFLALCMPLHDVIISMTMMIMIRMIACTVIGT